MLPSLRTRVQSPEPTRQKERINPSRKLSSDLHMCAVTHAPSPPVNTHIQIHTHKYCYQTLFFFFFFFFFRDRVYMCSPGCPGTHFVDQAGLKIRNLPASAGIKGMCHHTGHTTSHFYPSRKFIYLRTTLLLSVWLHILIKWLFQHYITQQHIGI